MKIYLASPFFNDKQIALRGEVLKFLEELNFNIFSPEHHAISEIENKEKIDEKFAFKDIREKVREVDILNILDSDLVLSVLNYPDEGVAYERGFAFAKNIPSIDFFKDKKDTDFYNLMYSDANAAVSSYDELKECLLVFKNLNLKFKENNEGFSSFFDYLKLKLGNKFIRVLTTSPAQEKSSHFNFYG